MPSYPPTYFVIDSKLFPRTRGEAAVDGVSEEELEARLAAMPEDEKDDYIQEGCYGKALAAFVEAGLRRAGFPVVDNFAEDHGRLVVLRSASGKSVNVVCANYDEKDASEDGTVYLVQVHAVPGIKARFAQDRDLVTFADQVAAEIENLIRNNPEIKFVRKEL